LVRRQSIDLLFHFTSNLECTEFVKKLRGQPLI
jgi:transcriptional regulator of met regulon